ncbi:hypothetical protein [Streptomyces sp. CB00455]|nr:hypothetical protein [Streptomyces sp. CB00455]
MVTDITLLVYGAVLITGTSRHKVLRGGGSVSIARLRECKRNLADYEHT